MIGDLVTFKDCQYENPMPIKIVAVGFQADGENDCLVQINGDKACDIIEVNDEIVGIPLTEEILQKNFPTPEEIVWWPLNDGSFRAEMQDDTHLIIGKYNYVHQLQHAMRLCGTEKEIVI